MSRHRNVRGMDYQEEYDGYDDCYGHSVEDDYCVSPSTAAQFMWQKDQHNPLSAFIKKEENIPEEGESDSDLEPLNDSKNYQRPKLDDGQEAMLNSCLEKIRDVLGDTAAEHVLIEAIVSNNFDLDKSLNYLLSIKENPQEQTFPQNITRKEGDFFTHSLPDNTLLYDQSSVESQCNSPSVGHDRLDNDKASMRKPQGIVFKTQTPSTRYVEPVSLLGRISSNKPNAEKTSENKPQSHKKSGVSLMSLVEGGSPKRNLTELSRTKSPGRGKSQGMSLSEMMKDYETKKKKVPTATLR